MSGLRSGADWARAALYDRHAGAVVVVLRRLLPTDPDSEIADLLHETFAQAYASVHGLKDAVALLAWLQVIASRVAFRAIRGRKLRRWLKFWEPDALPEVHSEGVDPVVREAYERAVQHLVELPADERFVFVLRFVEGWELERIAEASDVSLATVKRRIQRASERFAARARADEALRPWLEGGGRWPT
ncbi:MAG: sigma-70 family RNA polymerase sigma factor [Polyangiaceae bacterium]|nr:sigma-70 family RNA polymerase sigma factor [Polyangiaceae bacterium]